MNNALLVRQAIIRLIQPTIDFQLGAGEFEEFAESFLHKPVGQLLNFKACVFCFYTQEFWALSSYIILIVYIKTSALLMTALTCNVKVEF